MSAIFISHSSRDNVVTEEVAAWLRDRGHRSLFLDFDPEDGIPAGRNWEQELYRRLRDCRAMLVLCSAHSMASDWCFAELIHARGLGKSIIPIKVAPCTLRPQLAELQVIDLTGDRREAYERLRQGLRLAGLDPADVFDWDGTRPPYPGLMVFQEDDAAIFFGRDAEIQSGLEVLRRVRRFGGARLILFLGASGSGKSSLVRAGLLPRLAQDVASWQVTRPFRPMQRPLDEMAMVFSETLGRSGPPGNWEAIRSAFDGAAGGEDPATALIGQIRDLQVTAGRRDATVVVTVDQFEELLSPARNEQKERFLSMLRGALAAEEGGFIVVGTLRSDFFGDFQEHPLLRDVPFETFSLGPLSVEGFAQIIEGPARVAGLQLESGLVQAMVDDTETQDALPLLAFTLRELWERHGREDGRLTVEEYRERLGGLDGSVARAADAVVKAATLSPEQEEELHTALVSMVRINDEGQFIRQAVSWSGLPERIHPLLERFVKARLLVSASRDQERVLEVAHEALFRVWERLRRWLEEDRHYLGQREGLRRAAREWEAGGRQDFLLLHRGGRLEDAEALAGLPRFGLGALEREYLRACIGQRAAERAARSRRIRATIAGLTLVLVIVSGLGLWGWVERQNAQHRLATLHWVNGASERDRNDEPLKASHHFMQAAELTRDASRARNAYLAGAMLTAGVQLAAILEDGSSMRGAVFSHQGDRVLTWGRDGTARIWDATTGEALTQLVPDAPAAREVQLSPGRGRVLIRSGDEVLHILDSRDGSSLITLPHARSAPVFSPDEARVIVWEGAIAGVWDLNGGVQLGVLPHDGDVRGAVFDAAGQRVLTWSDDHLIRAWASEDGVEQARLAHEGDVVGAVFSEDGERALIWGAGGAARIWDFQSQGATVPLAQAADGNPWIVGATFFHGDQRILTWNYGGIGLVQIWSGETGQAFGSAAHEAAIRSATLSQDQRRVLTWSDDGTARVWDTGTRRELVRLRHRASVRGAVFNADESWILTWSDDGGARLWDARGGHPLSLPLTHQASVRGAGFAPGERRILTWSEGDGARVWAGGRTGAFHRALQHEDSVVAAAFLGDARRIVTLTDEGALSVWREDGARLAFLELDAGILGAVFTRDGARLVTWAPDGSLRIRDGETGQPQVRPMRHEASALGILGVAISPDGGHVLSWGDDRTARVWDGLSGEPLVTLRHDSGVRGAAFAGGQILTWSEDRVVRLWDTARAQELLALPHERGVLHAARSSDGKRIASSSADGLVRLWDGQGGAPLLALPHGAGVRGAVFSADGERLLTWSDDSTVHLWDVRTGEELMPSLKHGGPVRGAWFSAGEDRIVSWAEDDLWRIWDGRNGQALTGPLRHEGPGEGPVYSEDTGYVLAWSGGTVHLWNLGVVGAPVSDHPVLRQEVVTGTQLGAAGELETLTRAQWSAKRQEWQSKKR
jgi:WD40 repeat protein